MEKHFSLVCDMLRDRMAETIVIALLFFSGIILILAGSNWAWGCYIFAAIDLTAFAILFINLSKDIYNETIERIIQETVDRIEKSETR